MAEKLMIFVSWRQVLFGQRDLNYLRNNFGDNTRQKCLQSVRLVYTVAASVVSDEARAFAEVP